MQMLDKTRTDILMGANGRLAIDCRRATRFLLLSHPRSGTQMLTNALEAHPAVRLFNFYAIEPHSPRLAHYHANWCRFQWQRLPCGVTHLGTVHHRVGTGWIQACGVVSPERYWPMLAASHDRAICLYRRNLLRQFLSRQVGLAIGTYDVLADRQHKPKPQPLLLNVNALDQFVEVMTWLQADIDSCFPGRLDMAYESLCSNWDQAWQIISQYLDLPIYRVKPFTKTQETRPLAEAITNWQEIREWAVGRNHEEWLD